jgi:ferredoxin
MRIKINKKLCVGCEACVNICPDVFRTWGEFLKADIEITHQPERYIDPIRKAVAECPTAAIAIES